jgi:hypothetical protein
MRHEVAAALRLVAARRVDLKCLRSRTEGKPRKPIDSPSEFVGHDRRHAPDIRNDRLGRLTNVFARLHPVSVQNAVWVASIAAFPPRATLALHAADGGSWIPTI